MEVFGLAGWSGSGKTTLIKRLIPVLISRGISVSTIKHAHHSFDIDEPGKDSFEHRLAGADEVLISSKNRWAIIHENKGFMEPELSDLLRKLSPVNLVLVEGFKNTKFKKLEIYRDANKKPLLHKNDTNICAVASDIGLTNIEVPVFDLDDIKTISEFIMQNTGLLETL
jgi:molybdopterin-guanine dinucleotide biosynthesis protein MobB